MGVSRFTHSHGEQLCYVSTGAVEVGLMGFGSGSSSQKRSREGAEPVECILRGRRFLGDGEAATGSRVHKLNTMAEFHL